MKIKIINLQTRKFYLEIYPILILTRVFFIKNNLIQVVIIVLLKKKKYFKHPVCFKFNLILALFYFNNLPTFINNKIF